jgi:hypothetical protein
LIFGSIASNVGVTESIDEAVAIMSDRNYTDTDTNSESFFFPYKLKSLNSLAQCIGNSYSLL